MKRKHSGDNFPDVLNKIRSGEYKTRAPTDKKKYTSEITWSAMRLIFDEEDNEVQNFFYCSKCEQIFNLILRNSGQCLKRHVEKTCISTVAGPLDEFFVREFQPAKNKKISREDKTMIRSAAVGYIIKDMRPISSFNGDGMASLLSAVTYIGNKYGHIPEKAMEMTKLIPSRHTVSVLLQSQHYFSQYFHIV